MTTPCGAVADVFVRAAFSSHDHWYYFAAHFQGEDGNSMPGLPGMVIVKQDYRAWVSGAIRGNWSVRETRCIDKCYFGMI